MKFNTRDEDSGLVIEVDAEAIKYLVGGLNMLSDLNVGSELTTPSIWVTDDGTLVVGEIILRLVEDVTEGDENTDV